MEPSLQAKHLLDLGFLSDPRLQPSAQGARPERAVAVLSTVVPGDEEKKQPPRYRSRLQLVDLRPGLATEARLRELSQGEKDRAPRWSPDGRRLAFLRSPAKSETEFGPSQLALLDLDGGEARLLSSFGQGVGFHAWLDQRRLLLLSMGEHKDEEVERGLGRRVDRRQHRADGEGFLPTGPMGVYLLDADDGKAAELLVELPEHPHGVAVSPDGRRMAFVAPGNAEEHDEHRYRLWLLDLEPGARPRDLLGRVEDAFDLRWSADSKRLAWTGTAKPLDMAAPADLWLLDPEEGQPRRLSQDIDLAPSPGGDGRLGAQPKEPRWSSDGKALWLLANEAGRVGLAQVAVPEHGASAGTGSVQRLTGGDRVVSAFDAAGNHDAPWALMIVETPQQPGELVLRSPDGEETRLSAVNEAWAQQHRLQPVVEHHLSRPDGSSLAYFLLSPERPRDDRAIVVQVHGGPHTNDGFGFRFEQQMQAAAGYTVLFGNPRGSTSLGSAHATAMLHAYGTVDADDIMAAVDDALARHPDPTAPVHLTGGSYGGFMTNWLVGHSDRFRSAVTQRSICNWVSFFGTSDIGPFFTDYEVGAAPWLDLEKLWQQSPLKYVENVSTPILVLHAEEDHRCPIEQAEQWFTAIKRLGKAETQLVRFPGEGHELSRSGRPDRRVQNLELILGWFQDHP